MKARSALLVLVSLALATAPLAAATAPSNDLAAALAQPAVSSLAGGACASTTASGLMPAPTKLQAYDICGTCSLNPCKNAHINDFCVMPGFGNGTGVCLPPLGDNCSDGITWKCQCWSGPLP